MDTNLQTLPLSIQDWPLRVGARTPREFWVERAKWCDDHRGSWACSREKNHPLPHVASDGMTTIAIWDQQYYGDYTWSLPMRVADVEPTRGVTSARYRRARLELP